MQPVNAPRRSDPAPSRVSYRMQRLMLTPAFRLFLRAGLPMILSFGIASAWLADNDRRERLNLAIADIRHQIETRPEFMVQAMVIDGASAGTDADIREIVPVDLPASSFDLDLPGILATVRELAAVKEARVHVRTGGILQIDIVERVPVLVWRSRDGLELLDETGALVAPAEARTDHPDLPLVAGDGAERAVPEALALIRAAGPLGDRLRGLVRMGERRWDVVLDRDQRILLPEDKPVQALERVIALAQAQDMLERDLAVVDMRLSDRPTIRLAGSAIEDWQRVRATTGLGD